MTDQRKEDRFCSACDCIHPRNECETTTNPSTDWREEFIEVAAAMEHTRWAKWQEYFFSKCTWHWLTEIYKDSNTLTLPKELHARWVRQINTPYADLSEKEKESDRAEVRQYLPLIESLLSRKEEDAYQRGRDFQAEQDRETYTEAVRVNMARIPEETAKARKGVVEFIRKDQNSSALAAETLEYALLSVDKKHEA